MKQPPRGSVFEFQDFGRSEYLGHILHRLKNELGYYLELIEKNPHPSGDGVGFWSGIRMAVPVIETIAEIEGVEIIDFMEQQLHTPVPKLTWAMFRHSLVHNDQLQHAKYGDRTINWSISLLLGSGHFAQSDQIHIDVKTLYNDLCAYLEQAVSENDTSIVKVAIGFKYNAPPTTVMDELELLK